jgi:hypothetical protein
LQTFLTYSNRRPTTKEEERKMKIADDRLLKDSGNVWEIYVYESKACSRFYCTVPCPVADI